MRGFSPEPDPEPGVYRDLDGTLVQLLAVDNKVCCWTALGSPSDATQMTHRDNFLRRFVPLRTVVKMQRKRNPNQPQALPTSGTKPDVA